MILPHRQTAILLAEKDNGSTVAALYWHRDDEKKDRSILINSGDYYGSWWYSKD